MPDDENIEMIDKNTRRRNGKLERLDPIYGVWVIHPVQFYKDNRRSMDRMFDEIEEDNEREKKEMFNPERAKKFMEHVLEYRDLWEDEKEPLPEYNIDKVLDVNLGPGGFSKSQNTEIIFEGVYRGKRSRYIAGCSSYSGDFYEPPSEECWFDDIRETISYLEDKVKTFTKPNRLRQGNKGYAAEKKRLENIIQHDIDRLAHLKKFQPTWKYEE